MSGSGSQSQSGSRSYSRIGTKAARNWTNTAIKDFYGPTLGKGQISYPGTRVAPFTSTQTQAMDVGGFLDKFGADQEIPLYGETGTALSGILEGRTGAQPYTPESVAKAFSTMYEAPARKEYAEETLPAIQESYAGPGYWGGARARAVMEGGQDLADWLGTKRGGMEWEAEQANRALLEAKAARTQAAIPQAMEYGQLPTQEAAARLAGRAGVFEFAGKEQAYNQALIQANIEKFMEEKRITDPENMQLLLELLKIGMGGQTSSTIASGSAYSASGGIGAAATPTTATSDIRLKENLEPITNALEKVEQLKGHTYNFKGQDMRNGGIIAQDLEKVLPEGVVEINGFKCVKLDAVIGLLVNAINEIAEKMAN